MTKELYVIFDCVSQDFGEILSLNSVDEAKRAFALTCVNSGLREDLELYYLGSIELQNDFPTIVTKFPVRVCGYDNVKDDVDKYSASFAMIKKIDNVVDFEYSGKDFIENVRKLCRYFSKKDKGFGK